MLTPKDRGEAPNRPWGGWVAACGRFWYRGGRLSMRICHVLAPEAHGDHIRHAVANSTRTSSATALIEEETVRRDGGFWMHKVSLPRERSHACGWPRLPKGPLCQIAHPPLFGAPPSDAAVPVPFGFSPHTPLLHLCSPTSPLTTSKGCFRFETLSYFFSHCLVHLPVAAVPLSLLSHSPGPCQWITADPKMP